MNKKQQIAALVKLGFSLDEALAAAGGAEVKQQVAPKTDAKSAETSARLRMQASTFVGVKTSKNEKLEGRSYAAFKVEGMAREIWITL